MHGESCIYPLLPEEFLFDYPNYGLHNLATKTTTQKIFKTTYVNLWFLRLSYFRGQTSTATLLHCYLVIWNRNVLGFQLRKSIDIVAFK